MTELIQSLNAHAPHILRTLGLMEIQIVILALLVLAGERLLQKPLPKIRYALWLVVLAKCLLPPVFKISSSVLPPAFAPLATILPTVTNDSGAVQPMLSAAALILLLWLAVSLTLLAIALHRFVALRAQLREAEPITFPNGIANNSGSLAWPSLWQSRKLATPVAIGLWRPRIYLDTATAAAEDSAKRAVLCHELAHVLRRDGWIALLQTLAQILHPFNPFVWLMNVRLFRYREQICDAFALRHADISPQQYGEMLLRFLEMKSSVPLAAQSAAGFFETRRGFQQRLKYLLTCKESDMNPFIWKHQILLAGLVLALLPASWQCGQQLTSPAATTAVLRIPASIDTAAAFSLRERERLALSPADAEALQRLEKELRAISAQFTDTIEKTNFDPSFQTHRRHEINRLEELRAAIARALQAGSLQLMADSLIVAPSLAESNWPEPAGGLAAIERNLVYPVAALAAKTEGVVFLQILVRENGGLGAIKVLKSPAANMGFEEAAIAAVKSVQWQPAKAAGKPIPAWIGLPLKFSLKE